MVRDRIDGLRWNHRITEPQTNERFAGNPPSEVHRRQIAEHEHDILGGFWTLFEVMCDLRTGTGFDEEISPLRPSKRRDAEHEEVRRFPKRFRHKSESAREAESIGQMSGGLSREEIACQLHRATVIANRAAQDGRLWRLDSCQHIAPARRRRYGCRRAAKAANVNANHVVSSLRPFPLDVAP